MTLDSPQEASENHGLAGDPAAEHKPCRAACPVCGGRLVEIRAKLQCSQCHTIVETCCEGGPES